ncbi:MAG: hypothetical protein LAO24_24405 [Acidobacteriia bacterium]|nr:hypothetical protein [Terriglobia bacterium]
MSQSQRQLREAWGQFLSQFPWDWFVNLTFRGEVPTFRAYRIVGRFLRDLETAAGVPVHWFRADEYGARFGRFHMHLLVGNVAHLRRLYWMDEWNHRAGYARILPFDDRKGAAFYVAKYITKQGGEWAISENMGSLETQPTLPLQGTKTGGYHSLPVVRASSTRPPTTKELQKRIFVPEARSRPAPSVMDVYREEVSRFGRGRYREFLWPR